MSLSARVCVALPCYNEGVAIYDVVRSYQDVLPDARIVVFDNNSRDNTAAEARRAGAEVFAVPLQGKGNVVRRMFADVDADIFLMADGDGTYDASVAPALIRHLAEHRLDMVVGRRVSAECDTYRSGHVFGNWMLTTCVAVLFGRSFADMLSGYRVFSRRFAKSFPAHSHGFEIETELTVHALRLRLPVSEVNTRYFARPEGSFSKLNTYRDGFRILWMIAKLLKSERPFALFGAVAALSAVVSVLLALPIWVTFLETGLVPRLPTAVLCAALAIIAVIALVCGILLDAVTMGRRESRYATYLGLAPPPLVADLPSAIQTAPLVSRHVPSAGNSLPPAIERGLAVTRKLQTPLALSVGMVLVIAAIAAIGMRQDFNWDLQNYHLYNAWALLNDRLSVDLAPAMFQSYFNPLLDLPHYWLSVTLNWNARWVAFLTGAAHGLVGVAVFVIARQCLPPTADGRPTRLWPMVLAGAGCVAYSFVMELGTTMGDNSVAALVLIGFAALLAQGLSIDAPAAGRWRLVAGLLAGLATGLKLTAAPYVVALIVAAGALPAPSVGLRLRASTLVAVGAMLGALLTGGWWHLRMWSEFGNPVFPQFNSLFSSPLAGAIGYGDANPWRPQSIWEGLIFPFVVAANPLRISEVRVQPMLWPLAYVVALAVLVTVLVRRRESTDVKPRHIAAQHGLIAFVATAYLVWLAVFGIYRYTVAMEVLLPLTLWVLCGWLPFAQPWRAALRGVVLVVSLWALWQPVTQERVEFSRKAYHIEAPRLAAPQSTTILLPGYEPMAWLLTGFPAEVAAIGLANNFPESPAYRARVAQILQRRNGPVFSLIATREPDLGPARGRLDANASRLRQYGLTLHSDRCGSPYKARAGQLDTYYFLCETTPSDAPRNRP
ncbi:MAG: glycosyltransferase [Burkholderiales bacterium]|nr:glycosyltransferase [Burkholderiales bacterium]